MENASVGKFHNVFFFDLFFVEANMLHMHDPMFPCFQSVVFRFLCTVRRINIRPIDFLGD